MWRELQDPCSQGDRAHQNSANKEQQLTILKSEMEGDTNASKVPRYMSTEGGTLAEVWLDNLTALKAVQKWSWPDLRSSPSSLEWCCRDLEGQ